jgi:hypothetical protein
MIDHHFEHTTADGAAWRGMPGLVRPLTIGRATT